MTELRETPTGVSSLFVLVNSPEGAIATSLAIIFFCESSIVVQ